MKRLGIVEWIIILIILIGMVIIFREPLVGFFTGLFSQMK